MGAGTGLEQKTPLGTGLSALTAKIILPIAIPTNFISARYLSVCPSFIIATFPPASTLHTFSSAHKLIIWQIWRRRGEQMGGRQAEKAMITSNLPRLRYEPSSMTEKTECLFVLSAKSTVSVIRKPGAYSTEKVGHTSGSNPPTALRFLFVARS